MLQLSIGDFLAGLCDHIFEYERQSPAVMGEVDEPQSPADQRPEDVNTVSGPEDVLFRQFLRGEITRRSS